MTPSYVRKQTLDEVDGDESMEGVDDANGSEGVGAASSKGLDEDGDMLCLRDVASMYGKHTTITPPIAKVWLSVATATPTRWST